MSRVNLRDCVIIRSTPKAHLVEMQYKYVWKNGDEGTASTQVWLPATLCRVVSGRVASVTQGLLAQKEEEIGVARGYRTVGALTLESEAADE